METIFLIARLLMVVFSSLSGAKEIMLDVIRDYKRVIFLSDNSISKFLSTNELAVALFRNQVI